MSEYINQMLYYYRNKGKQSYRQRIIRAIANIKNKCRVKGIPFDMTLDDLTLNKECPILGIPIGYDMGRNSTPSVDRIDPNKGYVRGNVRIISFKANRWKNDMSEDDVKLLKDNWNKINP